MQKSTILFTLRHAETEYTRHKMYCGTIDAPLNREGIRNTQEVARQAKSIPFDVAVISSLRRTHQTARIFLGKGVPMVSTPLCNERDFGAMQGLTSNEIEGVRPRVKFVRIGDDYHSLNPPRGETIPMVRLRAKKFLQVLLDNHSGRNILVVSHCVFLQQFHAVIRNQDWDVAMAHPVRVLQMHKFELSGRKVLNEAVIPLTSKEGSRW